MRLFWRIVWRVTHAIARLLNSGVVNRNGEVDNDSEGMALRLRVILANIRATAAFNGGGPTPTRAVDDREWDDAPSGGASATALDRAFNPGFDRG